MRFLVRGSDKNGNVANFAENEQIIIHRGENKINIMSYNQLRGSIPLIWTQQPNLQLNPLIVPSNDYNANTHAFKRHITEIIDNYNKTVLINLVDKKNDQEGIGNYYQTLAKDFKDNNKSKIIFILDLSAKLDYVWFDFHYECKKMKYQNLSKLLKTSSVSSALNGFDYTHVEVSNSFTFKNFADEKFNIIKFQQGIFRTNCVDSLDRTNVVQSVFARQILHKILYDLKIAESPTGEPFDPFNPVLEAYFRNMWGEVGDSMSKCYSGTGALKSDFTKTGKRTVRGALQDGMNSSIRFYINNFRDGYNQDCHDYFLGSINPKKDVFKDHSTNLIRYVAPLTVIVAIILYQFAISLVLPENYENNMKKRLLKALILGGIFYLSLRTIFGNTKKLLINKPTKEQ